MTMDQAIGALEVIVAFGALLFIGETIVRWHDRRVAKRIAKRALRERLHTIRARVVRISDRMPVYLGDDRDAA